MMLDDAITIAHANDDGDALVSLYTQASELKQREGDSEAALFLLCQAYVFALENGHHGSSSIHARLLREGREA